MTKLPPAIASALAPFMPPMETLSDECEHDWIEENDSFDHAFGVRRLPTYLLCVHCGATKEPKHDY